MPGTQKYDVIPHLQFEEYTKEELQRIHRDIGRHCYPTEVNAELIPDYEQPFEVTISVLDESHGYPSEKDLAIKPGQLVVWLGGVIYVMGQMPDGASQTDVYRYPIIQDVPTGGRL